MTEPTDNERPRIAVVLAMAVEGAAPEDEFAGLPLALRTLLTLQKEGATRAWIVGPDAAVLARRFASDARLTLHLQSSAAATAKEGLRAVQNDIDGPFFLGMHEEIVDPAIYRALASAPRGEAVALVATREGQRVGPLLGTPKLLGELGGESFDLALTQLLAEGRARRIEIGAAWAYRVTTPDGRRLAFRALFEACRKPVDGMVARNLNRHISIFISKRLVGTPLTPNMLSVVTFLLGVAGAASCARGGYSPMLLGAFLFQWNSILDGVDGELARVRFQQSKLGQWLDTVSDDVSNLIFYGGVGIGSANLPFGRELALCAWIGIVTFALASAQFYVEMAKLGTGDLYAIDWGFDKAPPPGVRGALLRFFRNSMKKDFAILFFLVMALFGVLPYALPIIAAAAISNLVAATMRNVRRRRARPA